jgi:xylulokinase
MVNEQQTAGASLQFLKNRILFPDSGVGNEPAPADAYQKMDQLASSVDPGSDGLFYFPWLNGERSPFDVQEVRGGFLNLDLRHEQKHLVRAVMEGVALNMRWLMSYAERFCGQKFKSIRFIGGGAQSEVWSQILADVLQVPIEQMEDPLTANSKGAAALAWVALEKMTIEDIGATVKIRRMFTPNERNQEVYNQRFQAFVSFFNRNRSWFQKVNRGRES